MDVVIVPIMSEFVTIIIITLIAMIVAICGGYNDKNSNYQIYFSGPCILLGDWRFQKIIRL